MCQHTETYKCIGQPTQVGQPVVECHYTELGPILLVKMLDPQTRGKGAYLRSTSKTYVQVDNFDIRPPNVNEERFSSDSIRHRTDSRFTTAPSDSSDSDSDHGPPVLPPLPEGRARKSREHPLYNQTNGYILLFFIVMCVVMFTLRYNRHEIHKLKEEHGHDMKTPRDKQIWWHNALIYQIFPRSFQDSDGDGVGDLNGTYFSKYTLTNIYLTQESRPISSDLDLSTVTDPFD